MSLNIYTYIYIYKCVYVIYLFPNLVSFETRNIFSTGSLARGTSPGFDPRHLHGQWPFLFSRVCSLDAAIERRSSLTDEPPNSFCWHVLTPLFKIFIGMSEGHRYICRSYSSLWILNPKYEDLLPRLVGYLHRSSVLVQPDIISSWAWGDEACDPRRT